MPPPWPSSKHSSPTPAAPTGSSQPPPPLPMSQNPPVLPPSPLDLPVGSASPTRIAFSRHGLQPPSSPTRPTSSEGARNHRHNRTMSNPLPKLFSRKRSHGALPVDTDLCPDDVLVPVIESPVGPSQTPPRLMSGKKDDDRNMAIQQCMCCDNKVRFPRDLKVFRCTSCLTVNDLEPYRPTTREAHVPVQQSQQQSNLQHQSKQRKPPQPQSSSRAIPPLSVKRSKAIVDRCLVEYLEARCRRKANPPRPAPVDPFVNGGAGPRRSPPPQNNQDAAPRVPEAPVDSTCATVKTAIDFDWFPNSPLFSTTPSSERPAAAGPVTPSPMPSNQRVLPAPQLPPPPSRRPPNLPSQPTTRSPRTGEAPPGTSLPGKPAFSPDVAASQASYERIKVIFKPLEDYILDTYGNYECLNASFSTVRPRISERARSESAIRTPPPEPLDGPWASPIDSLQNLDHKTLMIGDFAENGLWWTGRVQRKHVDKNERLAAERRRMTTSKTPHINWDELNSFYEIVQTAGARWWDVLDGLKSVDEASIQRHLKGPRNAQEIDHELTEARLHAERALIKITENLLKRPTRPLAEPDHVRFLMIILMNPLLYSDTAKPKARTASAGRSAPNKLPLRPPRPPPDLPDSRHQSPLKRPVPGVPGVPGPMPTPPVRQPEQPHTGIRKRILGLMANSSGNCHRYLVGWFSRLPEARFIKIVDLVSSFVTYRLMRRKPKTHSQIPHDGGLIPDLSGSARFTSAQLRSATGLGGGVKVKDIETTQSIVEYSEDWQLKAAARVMSLLFAANNSWQSRRSGLTPAETAMTSLTRPRAKTHGQLLPTSDYYNSLLDYNDLVADFKAWEQKNAKFTFCQFPFLLSMGAKIKVLEYDARRQMESKAREAYFDSVTTNRAIDAYFHLRVRRECMVTDSLQQISAVVGQGQEELKKGLKVHFADEEGVDAGGLRKEWFLMIIRDIFDPNHGMFLYDDDSQTCYFNPNSFETSDQYYLVGALLGLAIYNSTILDVAFPPFAYRKLLAAAPPSVTNISLPTSGTRAQMTYTVDDLAEYRPALAAGLRQLLEFEGDVQETFCRDFVAPIERYGVVTEVPLCPGGEKKPVTNSNRQEFVDLYVRYLLDVSVCRQFDPFKRGFFTVCAGNALSLFRPEEIELIVRGSAEALDVDSLRGVAVYENWHSETPPHKALPNPAETVPIIGWFWDFFKKVTPEQQRLILSFITGSDRIPAVGATNLVLKICYGGDGAGRGDARGVDNVMNKDRFPIARTCFNMIVLWGYESREKLEEKLWRAVCESEGFGLK